MSTMDESAVKAIVERDLKEMMDDIGITHWAITVWFGVDPSLPQPGAGYENKGSCQRKSAYENGLIYLNHDGLRDDLHVLKTLRHELFHVLLAPFDLYRKFAVAFIKAGTPGDMQEDDQFFHAVEQTVTNLERTDLGAIWLKPSHPLNRKSASSSKRKR